MLYKSIGIIATISVAAVYFINPNLSNNKTYDGSDYSGDTYKLSKNERDFYRGCRSTLQKHGQYFLTISNEKGCACIAKEYGKDLKNKTGLYVRFFDFRIKASKTKSVNGGYKADYIAFAKREKISPKFRNAMISKARYASIKCIQSAKKKKTASKSKKPSEVRVYLDRNSANSTKGKTQTVTIVDKNGVKRKYTVPGNKGMIINGTGNGISITPRE